MEREPEAAQSSLLALLDATKTLASARDPDTVLETIVQAAAKISGASVVRLFLAEGAAGLLRYRIGYGLPVGDPVNLPLRMGESLTGEVAATGRPLSVPDCRGDRRARVSELVERLGLVSYLGLPVSFQGSLLGVLALSTGEPRSYTPTEIRLLTAFAEHAAIAIENARLAEATGRRTAELQGLLRTLHVVLTEEALQPILDGIVEEAARISGCSHVKLMLLDRAAGLLTVRALKGTAMLWGDQLRVGSGYSGLVAQTGELLYAADAADDPRNPFGERDGRLGIVSYLGLPVRTREELLGVLSFNTTVPRRYSEEELGYLRSFADQAAVALEHVRLQEAVRRQVAELEARVRERTARLEEALRVKAEFIAKMSHELRTPLNFILGYSQLLHRRIGGTLTAKQARFVERVYTAGRQLLGLVEGLLDISLAEAGRERLRPERLPVAPAVREVLDLYAVQAGQKHLRFDVRIEPGLAMVADRGKLIQILSNLVGNAVKFTLAEGRIGVTARRAAWTVPAGGGGSAPANGTLPLSAREEGVELVVEDSGIGILPADLERIFQGFEQVESFATAHYGGAGIGLAVVRTLVELHGGCVRAESEGLGRGARFVVWLPALAAGPQLRLLLVAGDGGAAAAVGEALEEAGYLVTRAATAGSALGAVAEDPPDLVLADLRGPGEGWEFVRRLQAGPSGGAARVPLLALTDQKSADAERALGLGVDEFLADPFAPGALASAVRRALAGRWRSIATNADE